MDSDLSNALMVLHESKTAYYYKAGLLSPITERIVVDQGNCPGSRSQLQGFGRHAGGDAQPAWTLAASASEGERERIATQLREYCKLDALAMVRIVDALTAKAMIGKAGAE